MGRLACSCRGASIQAGAGGRIRSSRPRAYPGAVASSAHANPAPGKDGYYLYGFVAAGAPGSFGPIGIGGPNDEVFTVPLKDLAAVVSRSPLREPVPDPEKAMAHARVLAGLPGRTG